MLFLYINFTKNASIISIILIYFNNVVVNETMRNVSNLETSCIYAIGPKVVNPEYISQEASELAGQYSIANKVVPTEGEVDIAFDSLNSPHQQVDGDSQPITRYFRADDKGWIDQDIDLAVEKIFGSIVGKKVNGYDTQILPRPAEYANAA